MKVDSGPAAGKLGAGSGSIRLALLSIIFQQAKLPAKFATAQFVIWLKKEGLIDAVLTNLEPNVAPLWTSNSATCTSHRCLRRACSKPGQGWQTRLKKCSCNSVRSSLPGKR